MKTRITPAHLQQLNSDQQNKLRNVWTPMEGDYVAIGDHEEMVYYLNGVDKRKTLPLYSTGELIELLTSYNPHIQLAFKGKQWHVVFGEYRSMASELRCALWEMVKKIL